MSQNNKIISRPIRFKGEDYEEVAAFAAQLSDKTGMDVTLPNAVKYALRFTSENDPKLLGSETTLKATLEQLS